MHSRHEYFEQHGNITVSLSGPKQMKQVNMSSVASLAALSLSMAAGRGDVPRELSRRTCTG